MIGTNEGEQYESNFDHLVASYHGATMPPRASEKPADASNQEGLMGGSLEPIINRDHHVPLVASALTDDNGQMYGMAIDHRIPPKPEYEKHLLKHEAYENDYMNDLVKNGMSSQDAYHKAHDWSTARESAAVTAEFGETGLEAYKQHWRDAASIASEPTDRGRHPDAHTTRHGLDEAELGSENFGAPVKIQLAENEGHSLSDVSVNAFHEMMNEHLRYNPADALQALPGVTGGQMAAPRASAPRMSYSDFVRQYSAEQALSSSSRSTGEVSKALDPISKAKVEGKVTVENDPRFTSGRNHYLNLKDEEGTSHGYINLTDRGDSLYVNMIQGWNNKGTFGTATTKDLLRQIKAMYPDAKHIMGYRVSGARKKAGKVGTAVQSLED